VALLERRRLLLTENIEALGEAFGSVRIDDGSGSMPSSCSPITSIATLPPNDWDYSNALAFDQVVIRPRHRVGRAVVKRRQMKHERGVWQRRFRELRSSTSTTFTSIRLSMGWVRRIADWFAFAFPSIL
jgi:putative transposase